MPAELSIYLPGGKATGDARHAFRILSGLVGVLDEIGSQDGIKGARTQWEISELKLGSVRTRIKAGKPPRGASAEASETQILRFVTGFKHAEQAPGIPPGWSRDTAKRARSVAKLLDRDEEIIFGINHILYSDIRVTEAVFAHLDAALSTRMETIGALTGRLEGLDLHGERRRARLWIEAPYRFVEVDFPDDKYDVIIGALRKRVQVKGVIHRDAARVAQRIEMRGIRIMPEPERSLSSYSGAAPEIAGPEE